MEFYTSVTPVGDRMLVRGYENGRAYQRKLDFMPTLFVNPKGDTKWRTLDGKPVEPVNPGTIKETRDFVKRYDGVAGFEIYGQTNYAYQYIADTYPAEIRFDKDQIKVFTIDIETATESGFPDIVLMILVSFRL